MNFYLPELYSDQFAKAGVKVEDAKRRLAAYTFAMRGKPGSAESANAVNQINWEQHWIARGRPYFKVWPSISSTLSKMRLDVSSSGLLVPCDAIAIRFSESDQLLGKFRVVTMSIGNCVLTKKDVLFISYGTLSSGAYLNVRLDLPTVEDGIMALNENVLKLEGLDPEYSVINGDDFIAVRVAVAVILLANDPTIIQPDVLANDRQRFDQTTDEALKQRLIDKARKRGIVGWRVGESYETIPHYRRPHFALRHTGKGKTVPRIVPVKGAIVHRQKLTEVPTGHLLPDGTEIET